MSNRKYYTLTGESLKKVKVFVDELQAVFKKRNEYMKINNFAGLTHGGGVVSGVILKEQSDDKKWRKRKKASQYGYAHYPSNTKEGKKISGELSRLRGKDMMAFSDEFNLPLAFTMEGLYTSAVHLVGENIILTVPEPEEIKPEHPFFKDATLLKLSEYYALKEQVLEAETPR